MSRQDQYLVTVNLDGRNLGVWDTLSGGEADSEETKHRAGGMSVQKAYGGPQIVGNLNIGRVFHRDRDGELIHWMISRTGKGRVSGTRQPLDVDGNPFGPALGYTGVWKKVAPGDVDSDSSDMDMYEAEISTDGSIS